MWETGSIVHEKQDGRLCAQHCLNAALQGSYFSAVDLGMLASRLDEEERLRMAENGIDSREYRQFIAQPSENMDDTGYFSVQVISRALALWALELTPFNSSDTLAQRCRQDPDQVPVYIFHMENHWFCIRRFSGGVWFNLNSLLDKPKFMSSLYLAEYIRQMQQEGYMVFIVSGDLPECTADRKPPFIQQPPPPTLDPMMTGGRTLNSVSSTADPDLDAAIRLSMEDFGPSSAPSAAEVRERRLAFFSKADNNP